MNQVEEATTVAPHADSGFIAAGIDAEERFYKEAIELPVSQMVAWLLDGVGQRIAATGVGLADARPLRGWREGGPIRDENADRVRLLYRVARTISEVYDDRTARAFLRSSSPYLDDRSPLAAVADGEEEEVVRALRAFMEA